MKFLGYSCIRTLNCAADQTKSPSVGLVHWKPRVKVPQTLPNNSDGLLPKSAQLWLVVTSSLVLSCRNPPDDDLRVLPARCSQECRDTGADVHPSAPVRPRVAAQKRHHFSQFQGTIFVSATLDYPPLRPRPHKARKQRSAARKMEHSPLFASAAVAALCDNRQQRFP